MLKKITILLFIVCLSTLWGDTPKRIIITGGPGAGKTTILLGMEKRGYDIVSEAANDVIKFELARNNQEPWDKEDFQRKVLELQRIREKKSLKSETPLVFYDRSPIDTLTYHYLKWPHHDCQYLLDALKQLQENQFYFPTVFLVETFGECTTNDIRHESTQEALMIEGKIAECYSKQGYRVVRVPPGKPEKRIEFILNELTCADASRSLAQIPSSSANVSTP